MCGICGEVSFSSPPDQRRVRRMMNALDHRGPDDRGAHETRRCALGHTRLSIIDLEGGHQPLANEDGSVWIVYNGEIYNYPELRRELLGRGHSFRTESDTEVIVHLYEEMGRRCVERLHGMFAFAIWDDRSEKLLLARDRFGQKPLFYMQRGNSLLFASEVKGIVAGLETVPEPDEVAIHDYLSLRFIPNPRSMFKGIHSLAPAHTLEFDGGVPDARRYWQLSWEPKLPYSRQDQLRLLKERLESAVRSHMVSDVPVGAFLSGGIDSSLVTAIAARSLDRPLPTFAVGSESEDFSEIPYARTVAELYSTEHHEIVARPNVVEALPWIVRQLDQPGDPITACVQCAAELAGAQVKVVLGGDGGDELFGGYDRLAALRWARRAHALPHGLRGALARWAQMIPAGHGYKTVGQQAHWFAAMMNEDDSHRYALATSFFRFSHAAKPELYTQAFWSRMHDRASEDVLAGLYADVEAKDVVDRMLATDVESRLPAHLLLQVDRMTMAIGLEARSPFLDHELGELIAGFPGHAKVRGRRLKALLREVARDYLPRDIVERPKQGFMLPISHWLRGELGGQAGRFFERSRLAHNGYLKPEALKRLIAEHRSGHHDHHHRLWMLLNLEVWWRLYVEGREPGAVTEELRGREAGRVRATPLTARRERAAT